MSRFMMQTRFKMSKSGKGCPQHWHWSCLLGVLLFLPSCAFFESLAPKPPLTEAQREEIQSRQWETSSENVHKATIFVLRGLGYQITSDRADTTLVEAKGLVSQKRAPSDCQSVWDPVAKQNVQRCQPGERYHVFRKLTLAMERIGKYTHLRLIIINVNSRYGDKIVTDNALHERIFSRIEERLFVRDTLE